MCLSKRKIAQESRGKSSGVFRLDCVANGLQYVEKSFEGSGVKSDG